MLIIFIRYLEHNTSFMTPAVIYLCIYLLVFSIASVINLQVSTVGDKEITLPKDTASLYASAWPKESPSKAVFVNFI